MRPNSLALKDEISENKQSLKFPGTPKADLLLCFRVTVSPQTSCRTTVATNFLAHNENRGERDVPAEDSNLGLVVGICLWNR